MGVGLVTLPWLPKWAAIALAAHFYLGWIMSEWNYRVTLPLIDAQQAVINELEELVDELEYEHEKCWHSSRKESQ
jgi:hypothetical protein